MTTLRDATPPPTERLRFLLQEARFGLRELRRHGGRIALLFVALWLPLWVFAALAEEVREGEAFGFDQPLLQWVHALHGPLPDRVFMAFSKVGYAWGVVPFDVLLVAALAWSRRQREGLVAGIAVSGSALLNVAAKHFFARARPALWPALAPEASYSFPSAHAMGSMTLAAVLVLLAWRTRWRGWVVVAMALFVPMVGASRVYLGVHYPSDILAGWAAALAWVSGVYLVLYRDGRRPWQH